MLSAFALDITNVTAAHSQTRFDHRDLASRGDAPRQLTARIIPKMEQLSAQLYTAFASFVDASKAEIDQLKQHVAELDQKCTNLEQSNARLEKRSTEQQNVLAVLMRERKMTMERLDGTASKPEKQQSTMEKRSHVASPLQAKNTNRRAKTALSKELAAAADQPLPSRESKTAPYLPILPLY